MYQAILLLSLLALSCSGNSTAENPKKDINPNGSSELALLMRDITSYQKALKNDIQQEQLPPIPAEFYRITEVSYTPGIIADKALFDGYAQIWLQSLEELAVSPKTERAEKYEISLNLCLACHQQHCQGPIPMIKGLNLP
jgi:hypothetical protein